MNDNAILPCGVFATVDEASRFSTRLATYVRCGYLAFFVAWAMFATFILVYAQLIYQLLGQKAESSFTRSWVIGLGMSQVIDLQSVLLSAAEVLLAMTVLETLWLTTNSLWMQKTADMTWTSVGLSDTAASASQHITHHIRFFKSVTP
jgi:hypothetical protein